MAMTDTAKKSTFTDTSTECAICYDDLDDGSSKIITLSCGHRYHLACIARQLRIAQPSKAKRLIFSGCRCAKCGAFCDHPELENLTRRTDELMEKVDRLVVEQLKTDEPDSWRSAANDAVAKAKLVDDGRRSYAFYLCGGCDEPYFGGTTECADGVEGELTTSEDRICQTCSPKSQAVCQHAFEHGPFHVWKCRYCCNPSDFVCYGNVHFCNRCHERNTQRARHRRQGAGELPVLEGIPCPGESCPFPKPDGCNKHANGSGLECEQVYYCASCESCPSGHTFEENPGSRNFVINPSGEEGMRGWQSAHGHGLWRVENMEIPVDRSTTSNFVSSYMWCVMAQTIPLHQYVRHPSMARLEVSAKVMARTDCPSVFRMEAIVTDSQRRVIRREQTSQLDAPADFWEKITLTFDPVDGAHEVTMVVYGKDSRFWQGNFGSKVCHCSVRVLGTEEELRNNLLPDQNNVQDQRRQRLNDVLRERALDIVLPIVAVIFFW
eukprot:CAMPEP_0183706224 /NCGR_PEP_ID=MMETSP0737-20130205/3118_1 /TAXON_ID=385413 /ORGANISM="Thalassiosira miniscula, Strain CCMP1093" /LENGTH=492 /DNA_ID=CAMNT_0025933583 /DNA_START=39 /DNA_END=1514 /DNA_ORIENTATION=-